MRFACLLAPLLLASPMALALDHPGKVGIGTWEKDGAGSAARHVARTGFAWHYNWKAAPLKGSATGSFVPMVWGAKDATPQALAAAKASGSGVLLGFNEPDERKQADMTVDQAVALWPRLMETGLRLGSPAPSRGEVLGRASWLGRFMAEADRKGLRVDFVAVHYYATDKDVGRFKAWLEEVHRQYRRPVWVTEWALADWNDPSRFSAAEQAAFAKAGTEMMDALPFVERHAWFAAYEGGDGWSLRSGVLDVNGDPTPVGKAFRQVLGSRR